MANWIIVLVREEMAMLPLLGNADALILISHLLYKRRPNMVNSFSRHLAGLTVFIILQEEKWQEYGELSVLKSANKMKVCDHQVVLDV